MTIVEFLNARYDEEELAAQEWQAKLDAGLPISASMLGGIVDPRRVLADIAAKRAIIAEYVARDEDVDLMLGPYNRRQSEWSGLHLAVQILASAYADQPGFNEDWKVAS